MRDEAMRQTIREIAVGVESIADAIGNLDLDRDENAKTLGIYLGDTLGPYIRDGLSAIAKAIQDHTDRNVNCCE